MGQFDEMIEMGEAVAKLGDKEPEAADYEQEDKPEPTIEEAPDNVSSEEFVDEPQNDADVDDEPSLRIEDLLGISGKEVKRTRDEVEQAGAKEPAPVPPEQPSAIDERFRELTERLNKAESANEMLIKKALGVDNQDAEVEGDSVEFDPDVDDYMKPYIEKAVGARLSAIEEQMRPVREEQERSSIASLIAKRVDGFTAAHVKDLETEYKTFTSEDDKALYGGGLAGAILLAESMVKDGKLNLGKKAQKSSPLASRHHSEASGRQATINGEVDEDDAVRALNKLSSDQILEFLNRSGID